MGRPRRQTPKTLSEKLRLHFLRSRCQAKYRNEPWEFTWEEFQAFWQPMTRFAQVGRKPNNLVLTRRDTAQPWNTKNCVIITRQAQLTIRGCKMADPPKPYEHLFQGAIEYGQ